MNNISKQRIESDDTTTHVLTENWKAGVKAVEWVRDDIEQAITDEEDTTIDPVFLAVY